MLHVNQLAKHSALIRTCYLFTSLFKRSRGYALDAESLMEGLPLSEICKRLKSYAPLSLAESWDNVGVLVEPTGEPNVEKLMLTIDLTEEVLDEAIERKSSLILSYHPPIFKPLKRLTQSNWKERIIVKAIENKIGIYSPHTAFDSLGGGINDWLISAYPEGDVNPIRAIEEKEPTDSSGCYKITCSCKDDAVSIALGLVSDLEVAGNGCILKTDFNPNSLILGIYCRPDPLPFRNALKALKASPAFNSCESVALQQLPRPDDGVGRIKRLDSPVSIAEVIEMTKEHLGLYRMRVALSGKIKEDEVKSIAVCAGSGGSVLGGVNADVYVTGELGHHELLDASSQGKVVLLGEHSNTERGYLEYIIPTLTSLFSDKVEVVISEVDSDPVEIM